MVEVIAPTPLPSRTPARVFAVTVLSTLIAALSALVGLLIALHALGAIALATLADATLAACYFALGVMVGDLLPDWLRR